MKKMNVKTTLILVLVVCSFTLHAKGNQEKKAISNETNEKLHFWKDNVQCQVKFDYPIFEKEATLNNAVAKIVHSLISDFYDIYYSTSPEDMIMSPTARNFELVVDYDEVNTFNNTISFVLSSYSYTGGAHGLTDLIAINYNRKTKQIITLKDIFNPSTEDWLEKLSQEAQRQLKEQVKKRIIDSTDEMIKEGTAPSLDNFSVFKIGKDSVTIIFNQYQVAPYASGMPRIEIPISFFK